MELGDISSPVVKEIHQAEHDTTGEIRVHISRTPFERDPIKRASRIFNQHKMFQTQARNAVLIYINLKKQTYALIADDGLVAKVGQKYIDDLGKLLKDDLVSTYHENAIRLTIRTIGFTLKKHFPALQ